MPTRYFSILCCNIRNIINIKAYTLIYYVGVVDENFHDGVQCVRDDVGLSRVFVLFFIYVINFSDFLYVVYDVASLSK